MNHGGPAFARPASEDKFNEEHYPPQSGMTLRDYFAGQAMSGFIAHYSCLIGEQARDDTRAKRCYQIADAMLAERAKAGAT